MPALVIIEEFAGFSRERQPAAGQGVRHHRQAIDVGPEVDFFAERLLW